MKKYLIIAAAALVASAACTKVETVSDSAPGKAISFQVANYVPQTKATTNGKFEGSAFHTYAWFHPTSGAAQAFMSNETITFKEGAADGEGEWSPSRLYFWPKTGYVNFFSYAGSKNPTVPSEGTVKYGDLAADPTPTYITIATDDDILLASAAYRYTSSDAAGDPYAFSYSGATYSTDTKGVPTLFHHMLAKVKFQAKFDASSIAAASGYAWNVVVNSITLKYANQGAITVTFTDPNTKNLAWPYSEAAPNWTALTGSNASLGGETSVGVNKEKITVTSADDTDATPAGSVSHTSGFPVLMNEVTVLPQTLATTGATVSINYTLTSYYSSNPGTVNYVQHIQETVDTGDIALSTFTPASGSTAASAWNMNFKYLYTITIKPNKTVTFDPAVVSWDDTVQEAGYTYPAN